MCKFCTLLSLSHSFSLKIFPILISLSTPIFFTKRHYPWNMALKRSTISLDTFSFINVPGLHQPASRNFINASRNTRKYQKKITKIFVKPSNSTWNSSRTTVKVIMNILPFSSRKSFTN